MISLKKSKHLIMVVDDEIINLKIVDSMLKYEGYRTILLNDPVGAVESAKENQPDVILLDVSMPGLTGFDVCAELKRDPSTNSIPILFLSGQTTSEFVIKGLELGAQDYITKPFNETELIARVETQLKMKIMVERLVEAEQIKALHAAMVSQNHELNQLTTSILGQVEILEMKVSKAPECLKCLEGIKAIEKAALEMDDKIKLFTNISKVKFAKYSERTDMLDLDRSSFEEE
jgi:DNA-binding response OmpR family regulator